MQGLPGIPSDMLFPASHRLLFHRQGCDTRTLIMMDRAVVQGVQGKKKRYPYLTVSKHGRPKRCIITFPGIAITNHYWAAEGGEGRSTNLNRVACHGQQGWLTPFVLKSVESRGDFFKQNILQKE